MQLFKNIAYYADGVLSPCSALDRAVTLAWTNQARFTILDVLPRAEPRPPVWNRGSVWTWMQCCGSGGRRSWRN